MKNKSLLTLCIFVAFFMGLTSCNNNRIFEDYHSISTMFWAKSDTISFDLSTEEGTNVSSSIGIRYNDDYEFHNLYLKYILKDSVGNILKDSLLNLQLFDAKTGKPLGSGFGNRFTSFDSLPLTQLKPEKQTIQFVQYMRKDELEGIEAIGLKITKMN